ncbi:putative C6 transcription factor [Aspergillus ibericus CBS 121593]|uniref:Transcription factor domain-containing protein n=1 Tax=Aspergillus ibericus CBS 121593 TaxID=1448316 RepID=A0A395GLX0_9EURO|nr:hypothetical protein BO80DRAFT_485495 [Aspergillus ibericus CBS 121593]RAK95978.1 hypothetical protein BO80DRAFT_485495 [Aspergillus ibericus CBS 121593]
MPPKRRQSGATNTRLSSAKTGSRKLTLSCSRCRASKLQMACLKRDIGHLCTKDERQPRAKRTKVAPSNDGSESQPQNTQPHANRTSSQPKDSEAKEAMHILEKYIDDSPVERTSCLVAPDHPNLYWSTQPQAYQAGLFREIINSLPEIDIIHLLHEVFLIRCQGPLGNVIHTPTFARQLEIFRDCLRTPPGEFRLMELIDNISMETNALSPYGGLVLGLAFHPAPTVEQLQGSDVHAKTWRSLALRCLQGSMSLFVGSIASLQAAVMLLLDGQEDPAALDVILVSAISGARRLGLHFLGEAKLAVPQGAGSKFAMESHIRTEIGIRIWWALVMRDWSRGQALGYYSIHLTQFNTRMPLHINDGDLRLRTKQVDTDGNISGRPRSEFTMLSYTVCALELAVLVRESLDIRGPVQQPRNRGQEAKMRLLDHSRPGGNIGLNATGPLAAIPLQRWMLHQQLRGLSLRLHRGSLSPQGGRMSCQLLAQNIIGTYAQIKSRSQVFNAAAVLVLGLMVSPSREDCTGSQLARMMSRDKAREAIELLRTQSKDSKASTHMAREKAARRCIHALEALMQLEEISGPAADADTNGPDGSLKIKVMDALQALSSTDADMEHTNSESVAIMPYPVASVKLYEPDVLPGPSNDPSGNFWGFLDCDLFPELPGRDALPLAPPQ